MAVGNYHRTDVEGVKSVPLLHTLENDAQKVSMRVVWTDYLQYKASLRGFDLSIIENIIRHTSERYHDVVTGRDIAVGQYESKLVLIPYESDEDVITPVTIHVTTRQQINVRIKTGRFIHG